MRRTSTLLSLTLIAAFLLRALPLLADATNAPTMPPYGGDDFDIGFVIIVMVMVIVSIVLLGLGLIAGIIVAALAGALTAFGILTSSVAIGFIRGSPASGFRALFIQLGAAAGILCGIGAAWLVSWLTHSNWSIASRLLVGSACGLVCGVAVALLFNFAWGRAAGWLVKRYESRKKGVEVIEA